MSAGRALLDRVFPQLRAVSVDALTTSFRIFFIYDDQLAEEQEEECRCAGTELLADYPDAIEVFEEIFLHLPAPATIVVPGILAYLRRESPSQDEAIARGGLIQEVLLGSPVTRPYILYATNRALLGEVTPNLREVLVGWTEPTVRLSFYYDGPITDQHTATATRAAARVQSWLAEAHVNASVERIDYPNKIPSLPQDGDTRVTIYARYEPPATQ
ncbi:MAG: hypothetical protein ACOYKZ_03755 [Chlamydiia bacterium]